MCPVCWATMLASFSIYFGAAAALLIWRDRLALLLALALLACSSLHSLDVSTIPWNVLAALVCALVLRIVWILLLWRDRLAFFNAWKRARGLALTRCPNRIRV
jgi:hypothetical protein